MPNCFTNARMPHLGRKRSCCKGGGGDEMLNDIKKGWGKNGRIITWHVWLLICWKRERCIVQVFGLWVQKIISLGEVAMKWVVAAAQVYVFFLFCVFNCVWSVLLSFFSWKKIICGNIGYRLMIARERTWPSWLRLVHIRQRGFVSMLGGSELYCRKFKTHIMYNTYMVCVCIYLYTYIHILWIC